MPAATQAWTFAWYQESPPVTPQKLLTISGRLSGFPPGARIQSAQEFKAKSEQLLVSHPLHAIHLALGAMPTVYARLGLSLPTIVPMVWVPCPTLSQAPVGHLIFNGSCTGSDQQAG